MKPRVYGTPNQNPPEVPKAVRESPKVVAAARAALHKLLRGMRWDNQGGYSSRHNSEWDFVSTGLGQVKPGDLDKLFAFAGIVPDEIKPKGSCRDCAHSRNGHERGYEQPCLVCLRPYHDKFVPKANLTRKSRKARKAA